MNKKNIVLIMADQLRKDSLGCYGNEVVRTPNIDRLAEKSVVFERNYCSNPICMPNRVSLMTGMNPSSHGVWTNGVRIDKEPRTLATELSSLGYQTASFGKLHFTPTGDKDSRTESKAYWRSKGDDVDWFGPYWGIEHVEMTLGHTLPLAHYGKWFHEKGGKDEDLIIQPTIEGEQAGVIKIDPSLHDSAFVGERASAFIASERDKERPFFMIASFPDPHHPFNPPEASRKLYDANDVEMPLGSKEDLNSRPEHYRAHLDGAWTREGLRRPVHAGGVSEAVTRERIAATYAMIELMDRHVGDIIDTLEREDLLKDTLIVFTSDHGELLGDHGLWFKGPFFYEGLVNIPLMIYDPDSKPVRKETLAATIDLAPTVMDMLDLDIPDYMEGISLRPALKNGARNLRDWTMIQYRTGFDDRTSRALITDRYKYVFHDSGEEELTDLKEDPEEKINIADVSWAIDKKEELKTNLLKLSIGCEKKPHPQISFS